MTSDRINSDIATVNNLLADRKFEAAFDILSQVFDGKNPKVAVLLGYIYGEDSFSGKDEDKSFLHYMIATAAGDAYAQQGVAAIFQNRGDMKNAIHWLTKASNNGNFEASLKLFYHHRKNKDIVEAFKFLRSASEQGNVEATQRYAIEMLKGNYGIVKIPIGFVTYFSNIPALIRYARLETKDSKPSK